MTKAHQIPATSVNPAYWAVLQGQLAGAHRAPPDPVNPYRVRDVRGRAPPPAGTLSRALALCWDYGFAGCRAQADDTVSRETSGAGVGGRPAQAKKKPGVGRGRGRLGPRAEWRDEQIEVLRLARSGGQGKLTDRDLAGIVGKSHDAVRGKLARRRVSQARSQPDPCHPKSGVQAP